MLIECILQHPVYTQNESTVSDKSLITASCANLNISWWGPENKYVYCDIEYKETTKWWRLDSSFLHFQKILPKSMVYFPDSVVQLF